MTPALDALVANDRAILDALTEGPTLFADWRRPGVHYLVSLDPSKPGRWRVTRFDADGPTGHIEAPGFREAAREARGMGAALATARGTAPCWLCGAPCAPSLDAEGPRCADRAQCFARQCAPPGGPASGHPCGTGACPEDEPCDACAAAYSEPWAEPDGDDGADAGEP